MANISDTVGNIELLGRWKDKHITVLLYLLLTQVGSDYSINVGDGHSDNFKEMHAELKESQLGFSGSGRWNFITNLECLHNWTIADEKRWTSYIAPYKDHLISYKKYLKKRSWLINQMMKRNLEVVWEFTDAEGGVDFLYSTVGRLVSAYNKEEHCNKLIYLRGNDVYHDTTLKNYCQLMEDGDDERLDNTLREILDLYKKDIDTYLPSLMQMVKQNDTWYNFPMYAYYETKAEIPAKFKRDMLRLFKEGDVC